MDKYSQGLILERKILGETQLTQETVDVAPAVGLLRDLLAAAEEDMEQTARTKRSRQEREEAEALAKTKVEAKEDAKEALKGSKKVPAAEKVKLEEALGRRHPGTPGLSGRMTTATGPAFLKTLLKQAKEKDFIPPPWEDRYLYVLTVPPDPPFRCSSVMTGPQQKKKMTGRRRPGPRSEARTKRVSKSCPPSPHSYALCVRM